MTDPKISKRVDEFLSLANVSDAPVPVQEIAEKAGVTIKFGPLPTNLVGS